MSGFQMYQGAKDAINTLQNGTGFDKARILTEGALTVATAIEGMGGLKGSQAMASKPASALAKSSDLISTEATSVLAPGDALRIENAATRIDKPITVVGSRASGTAGATSDWDYVIPGLTNKEWKQIKNSLPGSKSTIDNTPRNIDIFKGDVNPKLPHIKITARQ